VRGPFALWLRRPEIAERANAFGNALRADGRIDKRLFELMVLIVARHWSAQYAWFAHERHALKAGLPAEIIEAIRHGRQPEFARDDEKLVYDIVTELNQSRDLSEPSYRRGVALFGLDLFIEFVTAIGFYIMVAVMLKTFDAPVPDGTRPLPD
ncbi:unnamed protein product, partial [Phaeothamnion confervicola]